VRVVIVVCLALLLGRPLVAQDSAQTTPDSTLPKSPGLYRNPHRARVLGALIPGAGHIYAGEYLSGILAYEGTVGGIGAGVLVFTVNRCTFSFLSMTRCDPGPEWPHQALGVAIVGLGIWEWVSSARDAAHAAERANARHDGRSAAVSPFIAPFSGAANASEVGVSLHW
jgi:hypothetical protein